MPVDTLLAMTALMLALFWTPGPNNALLARSGLLFGFRPSVPHLLGVALGFSLMLMLVALGFGGLFRQFPFLADIVKWVGILALLWIAWKIAAAADHGGGETSGAPWSFAKATAFQWINPKGWVICIAVISQFIRPETAFRDAAIITVMSALTGTTSAVGWVGFGTMMQRWLHTPGRRRGFNLAMAGLILASAALVLWE
jgi:threonine/homoserine/homoserine lactone efflux protein